MVFISLGRTGVPNDSSCRLNATSLSEPPKGEQILNPLQP